mgnify:CR=1 FL=1
MGKKNMMGENDKADETVERGIESFADKAAEKEIRELTDFENAIDETLATGYLDDTLTVTDSDGVAQVLPVLDSEPISHLVEGLEDIGGKANVYAHRGWRGRAQRGGIRSGNCEIVLIRH